MMHFWGDESVDWIGIDSAATYIAQFCAKWGRIGGQAKEKYGTVRFYAALGDFSLHGLLYPKHMYNRFPKWLTAFDYKVFTPAFTFLFGVAMYKWQQYIYGKAYSNALKKWPHLKQEILIAADYKEFIKEYINA